MTQAVHYDCDPGQDDAVALLYALASPTIDIKSVSVVGGNARVEQCAVNALKILSLAGKNDVPVYIGAQSPLKRTLVTLPDVFGPDGLAGGENLSVPARLPEPEGAVDYLESYITDSAYPVTICATGPLTNLAQVLTRGPELAENIGTLVIMGGCPYPDALRGEMGNFAPKGATGKSEYNFGIDPEAALIVLTSNIADITMIGLNVTKSVLYGHDLDRKLRALKNPVAMAAANILAAVGEEDKYDYADFRQTPDDPVRAIHDVLAFAWMDCPHFFKTKKTRLRCDTDEPGAIPGFCCPADEPETGKNITKPVRVALSVDQNAFTKRMLTLFERYS